MFRIDETGLPISTSRVSTMPCSGERMVALRSSSSARSTAARDWATLASASATLACATTSWLLALRCRFSATSKAPARLVEPRLRQEPVGVQRLGALVGAPGELDVRPLGLDDVLLERGLGAAQAGGGGLEVGPRLAQAGGQRLLVQLDQDLSPGR